MPKEKKKPFDHWKYKYAKLIKIFAALGSVTAIVFHVIMIIESAQREFPNPIHTIVLPIVGILVCITLLGSIEVFGTRWFVKATWYVLFIGGVLESVFFGIVPHLFTYHAAWGLAGVLLIVASSLIALMDAL